MFHCTGSASDAKACFKAFHADARWFNRRRTVYDNTAAQAGVGYSPRRGPEHNVLHQIWQHANETCKMPSNTCTAGNEETLTVRPEKGMAVVFHHDMGGTSQDVNFPGIADTAAWHGACAVRDGVKWTAQKFKELPMENRHFS